MEKPTAISLKLTYLQMQSASPTLSLESIFQAHMITSLFYHVCVLISSLYLI